jgi:hypothetical protein
MIHLSVSGVCLSTLSILQDLNIEIVDDDDACGVLYDLMAGSILDPLLTSSATLRAGGVSWSLLAAGVALTALLVSGGGGGTLR